MKFIFKWTLIIGIIITIIGILKFLMNLKSDEYDGSWKYTLVTGIIIIIVSLLGIYFIG